MRTESDLHKELTPPSSQNLGTLNFVGLLFYMFLNLLISTQYETKPTLGFLTISPQVRVPSSLVHFPSSGNIFKTSTSQITLLKYRHHNGTRLPENLLGRLSLQGLNYSFESVTKPNHQSRGKTSERLNKNEN